MINKNIPGAATVLPLNCGGRHVTDWLKWHQMQCVTVQTPNWSFRLCHHEHD